MTFSVLGTDIFGQSITLNQPERRQGTYIIGATGTGKSTLVENLIMQDIDQHIGVGVLDPHGDLINRVIERIDPRRLSDVILLDIANQDFPFGLNLYECKAPQDDLEVQRTVNRVMHIFDRLYEVNLGTPQMSYYFRNCTHTIIANQGFTMAEIPLLLTDEAFRRRLLANVKNRTVLRFWGEYEKVEKNRFQYLREVHPILNKLDAFLHPLLENIVGHATSTLDFPQIMDERKILLVRLDRQLEDMTTLVGSVIIAQILNAALAREKIIPTKRKQFNLYVDEFQRFATKDLAVLLTEARKYGLATTIAHQARYQEGMNQENRVASLTASNLMVFRVSDADAKELFGNFDTRPLAQPPEEIGIEEIRTPVKDVVHHLLNSGSHPNDVVNQFATQVLPVCNTDPDMKGIYKDHSLLKNSIVELIV